MENELKSIDFNTLSKWGLIYKINKDILHPLGLALSRNPKTGFSEAVYIAPDLVWQYSEEEEAAGEEDLIHFLANREKILTEIIHFKERS